MPLDPIQSFDAPRADLLDHFADIFARTLDVQHDGVLVQIVPYDGGYQVAHAPLEGQPPADVLLGSVAPDDCWALGVVASGWVRPLGPHDTVGPPVGQTGIVLLVDRDGQVASRLDIDGERVNDAPAFGATLDCLQRAFGLPAAAARQPTGLAFAQQWLGDVCAVGQSRRAKLTWRQIEALHPACQLLSAAGDSAATDFLEAAGALARVADWETLRWMAVEGKYPAAGLTGAEAAWLDAGSFSRWVLSRYPGLPALLNAVSDVAGAVTARRCARALRQLGVLPRGMWRPLANV